VLVRNASYPRRLGSSLNNVLNYNTWESLLYKGYRGFPCGKERPGREADPSSLLVSWSCKSRPIPLLPLWVVMPVQSLRACTRVHFTLFYTCDTHWMKSLRFSCKCYICRKRRQNILFITL
jgi:hypothetical protein